MPEDRDEKLADAGWAADILGPDDFSMLQERGESVATGDEGISVDIAIGGAKLNRILAAYNAVRVEADTPEQRYELNEFFNQIINWIYEIGVYFDLVVPNFWEEPDGH